MISRLQVSTSQLQVTQSRSRNLVRNREIRDMGNSSFFFSSHDLSWPGFCSLSQTKSCLNSFNSSISSSVKRICLFLDLPKSHKIPQTWEKCWFTFVTYLFAHFHELATIYVAKTRELPVHEDVWAPPSGAPAEIGGVGPGTPLAGELFFYFSHANCKILRVDPGKYLLSPW